MSNDDLQQIVLGQLAARTRRHFLRDSGLGFGALAASSLGMMPNLAATEQPTDQPNPAAGADQAKPFGYTGQAKAKRVIYLHMSGGPPQLDMFDYKPKLVEYHMKPCPDEYLKKERFAFIKGHPKMLGSPHPFEQAGKTARGSPSCCRILPSMLMSLRFSKLSIPPRSITHRLSCYCSPEAIGRVHLLWFLVDLRAWQ